jgi:predicted negative regulator of RcsB-dependent stress response
VSPGPLAPSRELLGDMLVALHRVDAARAEYRATLEKEPRRRHSSSALGASSHD